VLDLNTIITDISAMVSRLLGEDMKVKLHLTPSLGLVEVGIEAVKTASYLQKPFSLQVLGRLLRTLLDPAAR
jgi:hypothetical protein